MANRIKSAVDDPYFDVYKRAGLRLKAARMLKKFSIAELARRSGMCSYVITYIEGSRLNRPGYEMSPRAAISLAKALDTTPQWLMFEIGN